jgi:hypothetical protein
MFLLSHEYPALRGPFECVKVESHNINSRFVLLVSIEPAISGIDYGRGLRAINIVFLLSRHSDRELRALNRFPIEVHVLLPDNIDNPLDVKRKWSEMQNIGWASLSLTP